MVRRVAVAEVCIYGQASCGGGELYLLTRACCVLTRVLCINTCVVY